jgi:hypothetical protein
LGVGAGGIVAGGVEDRVDDGVDVRGDGVILGSSVASSENQNLSHQR